MLEIQAYIIQFTANQRGDFMHVIRDDERDGLNTCKVILGFTQKRDNNSSVSVTWFETICACKAWLPLKPTCLHWSKPIDRL